MAIPIIIIKATGCIPRMVSADNWLPNDITKAENGMMSMPMIMDVRAVRFFIKEVIKFTSTNTTNGFTLAYQPGVAPSPIRRITYLGIVAYIWLCIIQNPLIINISASNLPFDRTLIISRPICPKLFPSPAGLPADL